MMNVAPTTSPIRNCEISPLAAGIPRSSRDLSPRRCEVVACIPRGRALFWQDERQGQNIEIRQGVVRAVRLLENGDRQILAFFWPGDIIRPAQASCQHYTAEAVTPCWVVRSNATDEFC